MSHSNKPRVTIGAARSSKNGFPTPVAYIVTFTDLREVALLAHCFTLSTPGAIETGFANIGIVRVRMHNDLHVLSERFGLSKDRIDLINDALGNSVRASIAEGYTAFAITVED